jgi:hypothetical protein
MPIRFYCPFCDKLLGITSRKAGTVVTCPSCQGQVGVPSPNAPPSPVLVPVPPSTTQHMILGPGQVLGLALIVLLLAGMAFTIGLLVGALG